MFGIITGWFTAKQFSQRRLMRMSAPLIALLALALTGCSSGPLTVNEYIEEHCLRHLTPEQVRERDAMIWGGEVDYRRKAWATADGVTPPAGLEEYHDALVSLLEYQIGVAQGQNPFETVGERGYESDLYSRARNRVFNSVPNDLYGVFIEYGCAVTEAEQRGV